MGKYFTNATTLEELRRQYKELLKKHHPDNGGSEEITKAINAEYDKLFKVLKDKHESKSAGSNQGNTNSKASDYNQNMYDWENDKELREILQKIINFNGIKILICGQWIWVSGNTYSFKKELKDIGFKWASQKKQWFWHSEGFRKKSHKTLSMDEIRNYYGSTKVHTDANVLLEA